MCEPQPESIVDFGCPRMGVVFRPELPPEDVPRCAAAAESSGVAEMWLWEDCFRLGGIAQAAVALASTSRLVVGLGVLPAPLRSVAVTAMEVATLGAMFPGRVRVGVGHGVQSWMRQAGVKVDSPMTLMREYVTALRALLAGETVTTDGRYVRLDGVALDLSLSEPVPVLVGGAGPKTLELAGEIADGVILDCQHVPSSVNDALRVVGQPGKRRTDFTRLLFLVCAPGHNSAQRLIDEARAWGVSPGDQFGVGGDIPTIRSGITPYLAAGVNTVVLQSRADSDDFFAVLQAAAGLKSVETEGF